MPCKLCNSEKIYDIASHYSPRAITKMTFGDSNKEEIYTISPYLGEVENFKGRAHPEGESGVIKPLPNTGKGIFCKKCEKAFEVLENICQPALNDYLQNLYIGKLELVRIKQSLKSFTIPIPSNILILFLYTVIWRQCLQQKTDVGTSVLSGLEYDYLQSILLNELFKTTKEITSSENFSSYPRISIFTSKRNVENDGWANPSPLKTNPELFFLGRYCILYFDNKEEVTKNLFSLLGIPTLLQYQNINLRAMEVESQVTIVPEKMHTHIITTFVKRASDEFMMFHIKKVANCKKIKLRDAEIMLQSITSKISTEIKYTNYSDYVIHASNLICN
jgi:hypothetical protein